MSATAGPLLTQEEFRQLPNDGRLAELVRGRVVELPIGTPRHGWFCASAGSIIGEFVRPRGLGRVVSNNAGVITERNPDTVRGPDLSYYGYSRLERGPLPDGYVDVVPDLVIEVVAPSDHWGVLLAKTAEYLNAGVTAVCVLDMQTATALAFRRETVPTLLTADDELTLPDVFGPEFRVPVSRFFAE